MVELAAVPEGHELEDLVAAHFQARGCFVERSVTERDPMEIGDLDIVWTDYASEPLKPRAVEVKGGATWGMPELFKFYGWTQYHQLAEALFVCRELPGKYPTEFIESRSARMGIRVIHADSVEPAALGAKIEGLGLSAPSSTHQVDLWRW